MSADVAGIEYVEEETPGQQEGFIERLARTLFRVKQQA
jgi:septum site-determining protein MinD